MAVGVPPGERDKQDEMAEMAQGVMIGAGMDNRDAMVEIQGAKGSRVSLLEIQEVKDDRALMDNQDAMGGMAQGVRGNQGVVVPPAGMDNQDGMVRGEMDSPGVMGNRAGMVGIQGAKGSRVSLRLVWAVKVREAQVSGEVSQVWAVAAGCPPVAPDKFSPRF